MLEPHRLALSGVTQVVMGENLACALQASGIVTCWGDSYFGNPRSLCDFSGLHGPKQLSDFPQLTRIAMAADNRLCGLTNAGDVYCKGSWHPAGESYDAGFERKPDPNDEAFNPQPDPEDKVHKMDVPVAREVTAGQHHFCSLGADGSVTCWGANTLGQSGAPTESCVEIIFGVCRTGPHRVALPQRAMAVAAGGGSSCAILQDRRVACWGGNDNGRLGFKSDAVCHPYYRGYCDVIPGIVERVSNVVKLKLPDRQFDQTYALERSGQVMVWPDPLPKDPDPRPEAGPCTTTAGALQSEEVLERRGELLGTRIRVRGKLHEVADPYSIYGDTRHLIGKLGMPENESSQPKTDPDEEMIVDGRLLEWHYFTHGSLVRLGLRVFDMCRVKPGVTRK
jgi:hypothetical protein